VSTPTTSLGPVAAVGGGDGGDGGCVGDDGGDDLGELVPMLRLYYAVDESVGDRQTDGRYSADNTGINHAVGGLSCLPTLVTHTSFVLILLRSPAALEKAKALSTLFY